MFLHSKKRLSRAAFLHIQMGFAYSSYEVVPLERIVRMVRYFAKKRVSLYASSACYFLSLSVFPMLTLLLGLLRYTGLGADALVQALSGLVPVALLPLLKSLVQSAYHNTGGALISLSAVTALWSASRGIFALQKGLDAIYEAPMARGYWYQRSVSVGYTFAFLLVLVVTLVLGVFGQELLTLADTGKFPFLQMIDRLLNLRFFVLLGMLTAFFCLVFRFLPSRGTSLRDSLPGALLTTTGWLLFTRLYSLYVTQISSYTSIYGSVYTLALSLLWLYCCISLIFYGGAWNQYLLQRE